MEIIWTLCLLIVILTAFRHTLKQGRSRLHTPLGPDEYFFVPEDNLLTAEINLTLREIARTAPHMRNGSIASLEEVLEHYNRGGVSNPYLDTELRPLRLTIEEKQALVAFLKTLSGTYPERD